MKESQKALTIWFYLYEVVEQAKSVYIHGSWVVITSGYGLLKRKREAGDYWDRRMFYILM